MMGDVKGTTIVFPTALDESSTAVCFVRFVPRNTLEMTEGRPPSYFSCGELPEVSFENQPAAPTISKHGTPYKVGPPDMLVGL